MCVLRKRGSNRLSRGMELRNSAFMGGSANLFGNNFRFFRHHHGDFVPNRIDALASFAFEPRIVGEGPYGFFANGAGEYSKQSFRNQHKALQVSERMYQMRKTSASADTLLL